MALRLAKLQRQFGVEQVASVVRNADEHASAPVGGADTVQHLIRPRRREYLAHDVDVKESLANPADHGRLVATAATHDQADLARRFRPGAQNKAVASVADDIAIGAAEALQHFVDEVFRLVNQFVDTRAHVHLLFQAHPPAPPPRHQRVGARTALESGYQESLLYVLRHSLLDSSRGCAVLQMCAATMAGASGFMFPIVAFVCHNMRAPGGYSAARSMQRDENGRKS